MRLNQHTKRFLAAGSLAAAFLGLAVSCGGPRKIDTVRERNMSASLVLPQESEVPELEFRQ